MIVSYKLINTVVNFDVSGVLPYAIIYYLIREQQRETTKIGSEVIWRDLGWFCSRVIIRKSILLPFDISTHSNNSITSTIENLLS